MTVKGVDKLQKVCEHLCSKRGYYFYKWRRAMKASKKARLASMRKMVENYERSIRAGYGL